MKAFYPYVGHIKPDSLFEFGCNIGKNLKNLAQLIGITESKLQGIDISKQAVQNKVVKNISLGDEHSLKDIDSNSHEMAFTCSVLCHMTQIDKVLIHLERISSKYVLLVESQDDHFDNHIVHDYESWGYKVVFEEYTKPGKNILYKGYFKCVI